MNIYLDERLARVRERIARAADRSGRDPGAISVVAVTKRQPAEYLREACAAGVTDVGENYVQEALTKREDLDHLEERTLRWHLIGHLQSNKAKQAVAAFDLIQSVDSLKLARIIAQHAQAAGKTQSVLLQVHLGDELTKTGLPPESILDAASQMDSMAGVELQGLMGIAPAASDPSPYFASMRNLFEALPQRNRRTLSMGMTADFEAAIAEGSTMVRIGTAIFGPR